MEQPAIDCFTCRHLYITWDKHFPYGCKALGFKSRHMPSRDVYTASGAGCLCFEQKSAPARKARG